MYDIIQVYFEVAKVKLVEMKCKNCGAKLKVDDQAKEAYCQFCESEFKIDDEVKHIKIDDMEQAGYDFEKGKQRAKSDNIGRTAWLVMAWIFLFPITATYFIAVSKKFNTAIKIVLILLVWIIMGVAVYFTDKSSKEDEIKLKKDRIVRCYSGEVYDKLDELVGIEKIDSYYTRDITCEDLVLEDDNHNKIEINMNDNKLVSIKLGDKYIYNE